MLVEGGSAAVASLLTEAIAGALGTNTVDKVVDGVREPAGVAYAAMSGGKQWKFWRIGKVQLWMSQ